MYPKIGIQDTAATSILYTEFHAQDSKLTHPVRSEVSQNENRFYQGKTFIGIKGLMRKFKN
jgi:hypothetical protein